MIDYKKVIRSEPLRYAILNALCFVPDKIMLRWQYWVKTGRKLKLNPPKRYTEKLQWCKIYYRNDNMRICSDKWTAREYVKSRGMAHILNDCYAVYDTVDEFDWDTRPNRFVIKDTLGAGGRSMIFVDDKSTVDRESCERQMQKWLDRSSLNKSFGREWVYEGTKHSIMVEKILIGDKDGDLPDYKFFCFDGKVFCSYMMRNYTQHHELGKLGFLDRDFKLMDVYRSDFQPMKCQPDKPKNYDEMLRMAEVLAEGFPHVRVDFYNIDGTIIFGEMTFFGSSGYLVFHPDEFDYTLGNQFHLPPKTEVNIK